MLKTVERTERATGRWLLKANGIERWFDEFNQALQAVSELDAQGTIGEWSILKSTNDGLYAYREGAFKETALSAPAKENAQSQPVKAVTVYIRDGSDVKANGQALVVAQVSDVAEALEAFRKLKGADVTLLLKYTDGSGVVTPVDCKRQSFGTSWVETAHPRRDPEGFFRVLREYGVGG